MQTADTLQARIEHGKERRAVLGRLALGDWKTSDRKSNPLELLKRADAGKLSKLLPTKYERMSLSPFTFFRGSVAIMADDLASGPSTGIVTQICGDAHVRNLGFYEAADGRVVFDLNDFDETIEGPFEWDIKRLATSLVLAGREAGNRDGVCKESVHSFLFTYRRMMKRFSAMPVLDVARYQVHRFLNSSPISRALAAARHLTPVRTLRQLVSLEKNGSTRLTEVPGETWRTSPRTRREVLASIQAYQGTLNPEHQHLLRFYTFHDVAFRIVGTGSVGTRDYLILMFGNGGNDPVFLQVKEEGASAYAKYLAQAEKLANQGMRVAQGQRRIQSQCDPLLGWTSLGGRDYLVRQFKDHKAGIDITLLKGEALLQSAQLFGEVLAKGHARSGDPGVIWGYCGDSDKMDTGIQQFAARYADEVTKDFERFKKDKRFPRVQAKRARAGQ